MKNKGILILFAITGFMFSSFMGCEDALDVTETITFTLDVEVAGEDGTFQMDTVYDLAELNSVIANYGNKIKDVEIESVTYRVKPNFSPENLLVEDLVLTVGKEDGSNSAVLFQLSNLALDDLVDPRNVELQMEGAILFGQLAATAPHTVLGNANVTVNEAPFSFVLVLEVVALMTANPL